MRLKQRMGRDTEEDASNDFVLITFLLGNDFIPKHPVLYEFPQNVEDLLKIYKEVNLPLTEDEMINWDNFYQFISVLSSKEGKLAEIESKRLRTYRSISFKEATKAQLSGRASPLGRIEEGTIFSYTEFVKSWFNHIFLPKISSIPSLELQQGLLLYDLIKDIFIDKNGSINMNKMIDEMIDKYINTIAWCYSYYYNGISNINLFWYYPFYYAPLFRFIQPRLKFLIANNAINLWRAKDDQKYQFGTIHQLLSVLPPSSIVLLPKSIQYLAGPDSPVPQYFPKDFIIDLNGVMQEWEGIPLLPFVDPYKIMTIINELPNTIKKQLLRYHRPQFAIQFDRKDLTSIYNAEREKEAAYIQKELELQRRFERKKFQRPTGDVPFPLVAVDLNTQLENRRRIWKDKKNIRF